MKRKNIAVFFGGVSVEHSISVITATQVMAVARKKYNVFPIYIFPDGKWYCDKKLTSINEINKFKFSNKRNCLVTILPYENVLYAVDKKNKLCKCSKLDCAIICNHGLNGEDGSLQGLLKLANIPFTSSDILGSAIGMDKITQKQILSNGGVQVVPYTSFTKTEYEKRPDDTIRRIIGKLSFPIIIKPSNLGSSIGINKANNQEELIKSIETAISYDTRIIAEKCLEDFYEVNCSAVMKNDTVLTSVLEKPINWHEFLTFDDKYKNGDKSNKGMCSLKREIPAVVDKEIEERVKVLTIKVYKNLYLKGVIRCDFLVSGKELYFNEVNTIPGSMGFYLWEKSGIDFSGLIDIIIDEAIKEYGKYKNLSFAYETELLCGGKN